MFQLNFGDRIPLGSLLDLLAGVPVERLDFLGIVSFPFTKIGFLGIVFFPFTRIDVIGILGIVSFPFTRIDAIGGTSDLVYRAFFCP